MPESAIATVPSFSNASGENPARALQTRAASISRCREQIGATERDDLTDKIADHNHPIFCALELS